MLYSEHVLSEEALTEVCTKHEALVKTRPRPTRSNKKATSDEGPDVDMTMGYQSFKRGDVVMWDGDQLPGGEDAQEIVFACMIVEHRGQQRRYLITYEPTLGMFSLNAWTSWKRVPIIGGCWPLVACCWHDCMTVSRLPLTLH